MRRSRLPVVAVLFVVGLVGTSAARQGQDAVLRTDAGVYPKAKQVVVLTSTFKITDAVVTIKAAGQTGSVKQTITSETEEEVEFVVVDKATRQVTRARTTVTTQKVTTATTSADGKNSSPPETKTSPLQGKTIVGDRLGAGKWKYALAAGRATADEQKDLDRRVGPENDDDLFPAGAVKVGREWTVDAAKLQRLFGGSLTGLKGTLTLRRESDAPEGGEKCAVVTSSGKVTGQSRGDDGSTMTVELELAGKTWRSLDTRIDVRDEATGTIRMFGKVERAAGDYELELKGKVTISGSARLKTP